MEMFRDKFLYFFLLIYFIYFLLKMNDKVVYFIKIDVIGMMFMLNMLKCLVLEE